MKRIRKRFFRPPKRQPSRRCRLMGGPLLKESDALCAHEPTPSPSKEGSFVAGGGFSSPPGRGAGVGRFMERKTVFEFDTNRNCELGPREGWRASVLDCGDGTKCSHRFGSRRHVRIRIDQLARGQAKSGNFAGYVTAVQDLPEFRRFRPAQADTTNESQTL